jgi:DNA (cytosine-5)-methyltransferase 1
MKKVIDLFCGAGGLSSGLKRAGFTIAVGVDIDPQALETYQNNFHRARTICGDIVDITGTTLREQARLRPGDHEFLLAGCPPCQGFSSIGKRDANDAKNRLVFEYVRLIRELQPNFILMENVPGMAHSVGKKIFQRVIRELSNDYHIDEDTLNAADYGVPQHRKRLVLHGVRNNVYQQLLDILDVREINFLPLPGYSMDGGEGKKPWISAWEAIKDLPAIAAGESLHEVIPNHVARSLSETNLKRLAAVRDNGGNRRGIAPAYELECHKKEKVSYTDTYGIMEPDRPAPTMTAGCTFISKGRFGHPTQNRGLSMREAARLQSFADDFVFYGSLTSMAMQIGNAVPPRLAEASGKVIYKYMNIYERYMREHD